jgi:transketolase N-terminal domain/subunit
MNNLERRIIDISYKYKLSHIGSCLNAVNFISHTYETKEPDSVVVVGNAHAGLALYVVLEDLGICDAEEMFKKHGVHVTRDPKHGIAVSGGSLGQAETIGVGLAFVHPTRNVYIITSDGACAEGSVWECMRLAGDKQLENLRVAVISNGYGGYGSIDSQVLDARMNMFYPTLVVRTNLFQFPDWIQGLNGHYVVMDEKKYKEITK